MKDRLPIEKLLQTYPSLLQLPGADHVVRKLLGQVQTPLVYQNHDHWTTLKNNLELKSACELYLIEILKSLAKILRHTPTLDDLDQTFLAASCPTIRYFLFKLNLFERSYRKLLILCHLPLNRDFVRKREKSKKR